MKKPLHLALFLGLVAALAALALTVTHNITDPVIQANAVAKDKEGLEVVFPNENYMAVDGYTDDTGKISAIYKADSGYVYKMVVDGFGGTGSLTYLVGFDDTGTIKGYTVTDCQDTKNIGSRVTEDEFINTVIGKTGEGDIDTLSGATISSTAVVNGIKIAADHFAANYKGK